MHLSDLKNGQTAFISIVDGSPSFRLRLEEMGFVPGQEVTRTYASPLGTPIVYAMLGQKVALRRTEANRIEVASTMEEALRQQQHHAKDIQTPDGFSYDFGELGSRKALSCDNTHCRGCSACGTHHTVDPSGHDNSDGLTIALVGNPNCGKTAFFNAASGGHERTGNYAGVTVSSVVGHTTFEGQSLRVVDLPGTYSLRAFSPEEAFVANELAKGTTDVIVNVLDVTNLERNLLLTLQLRAMGIPMVGVLNMYDEFEQSGSHLDVATLEQRLGMRLIPTVSSKGRGVKDALRAAISLARTPEPDTPAVSASTRQPGSHPQTSVTKARSHADPHATVHGLLDGIYRIEEGSTHRITAWADRFFVRTPLAYLLFIAMMGMIFYATFELGAYPMDWMEQGIDAVSAQISGMLPEGWLRDLFVDGIIGGVGSVIVFLPNILILYFFISLLEDSGYLARAALLADPLLRRVGLHGKSFVPMLMGFGCSVPAVMATRTIESRKSRLITMMTLPFMSCSARLPVYTILCGAFFPDNAAWVMLGLYAAGILMSFSAAWLLSLFFHRGEQSHFVMEMPPYRMPVARGIFRHTWEKGRQYLRKMGGIILVASMVIWALGYFPHSDRPDITPADQQEQSYLGQMGHAITPVLSPLGYDWHMGVGLVAGIGAKELMVTSLGVLYNCNTDEAGQPSSTRLGASLRQSGITPAGALSYLVFALLYFPCLATIAAIRGESGRWKYAVFTSVYTTLVAYVMAFLTYQLFSGLL